MSQTFAHEKEMLPVSGASERASAAPAHLYIFTTIAMYAYRVWPLIEPSGSDANEVRERERAVAHFYEVHNVWNNHIGGADGVVEAMEVYRPIR